MEAPIFQEIFRKDLVHRVFCVKRVTYIYFNKMIKHLKILFFNHITFARLFSSAKSFSLVPKETDFSHHHPQSDNKTRHESIMENVENFYY